MIDATAITKTYTNGTIETKVLRGIDIHIPRGEFTAIMGKSGAGKSTLLYQLGLLDRPTSGGVMIDGTDVLMLTDRQATDFRLRKLGYVFQDYALVPELTAQENVMMPLLMLGMNTNDAKEQAKRSLERIGMGHRLYNRPSQLSGGEQQRVSIARAVVQDPLILFADEPTANLDSASSDQVLEVFTDLHREGQTIVMVTHEKEYTRNCDRIIYLEDGKIVSDEELK
jgi:putative ABC transport system ATP-binding protein